MVHEGVGTIIKHSNKDLYFVQHKDSTYPLPQWRNKLSTWGGAVEPEDKSLSAAAVRELNEEIESEGYFTENRLQFVKTFVIQKDSIFIFHLFEAVLTPKRFDAVSNAKINEGQSVIIAGEALSKSEWVWGLETAVNYYLEN